MICELDKTVQFVKLNDTIIVIAAGGQQMRCDFSVRLDIEISTALGRVFVAAIDCLVLEGDENEFLLGKRTLKDLGIDIDRVLEQLIQKASHEIDQGDVFPDDHVPISGDGPSEWISEMGQALDK